MPGPWKVGKVLVLDVSDMGSIPRTPYGHLSQPGQNPPCSQLGVTLKQAQSQNMKYERGNLKESKYEN